MIRGWEPLPAAADRGGWEAKQLQQKTAPEMNFGCSMNEGTFGLGASYRNALPSLSKEFLASRCEHV